jgi:CRP-like cAMP-binding protein
MSSRSLWDNIFRQRADRGTIAAALARVPIFKNLSRAELALVKNMVHERSYSPGEVVFLEGQPGTGMYVVIAGEVSIALNYGREEEIVLAQLKDGDFFGEISLLDESARSATAVAVVATELVGFFRSDLMDLIEKSPRMGNKIMLALAEVLGERLRATNTELRRLHDERRTPAAHTEAVPAGMRSA